MIREPVPAAGSPCDMLMDEPHTMRQRREDNIKKELVQIGRQEVNWSELPLGQEQYVRLVFSSRRHL
jgi:hypothetical protein